jgi:integrase
MNELALQTTRAMQESGYEEHTAWRYYGNVFVPIVRFFKRNGKEEYDTDTMAAYIRHVEERTEIGKISASWYSHIKRGVNQLMHCHETGSIDFYWLSKASKFKLNGYYENILSEFLSANSFHPNTQGDIVWVAKKYFAWLIMDGHPDLTGVGVEEIQRFMHYCFRHMRSSSVHNVKLYMKKLYCHLSQNEYSKNDYLALFTFRVSRETRVLPDVPAEELAATLMVIDRLTPLGKRNYAILLLAAVTGLRAIDIIKLKLTDIDWLEGEIRIVQSKTGESLSLPLTKDVGEAIQDYILKARPKTDCENIFIRRRPPHCGIANATSLGDMYDSYRNKAGLTREAFDGKSFHSIRRSVGKSMVTSGIPVTTVAQILGHGDIDSTKQYISLDARHLKECALDFSGIEVASNE